MGVLSSQQIRAELDSPYPLIADFQSLEEQLQANGFDLTLRSLSRFKEAGRLGAANEARRLPETEELAFDDEGYVYLAPGPYVARLNETISLPPDIMALAKPRSSLLRSGIAVHNAVWDAGYSGQSQVQIAVYNPHGFLIGRDARIIQMVFFTLDAATHAPYAGSYQGEHA